MSKSKKPKQNPIEDAIGERVKSKRSLSQENLQKIAADVEAEMIQRGAREKPNLRLRPMEIPETPSPSKMSEQSKQELRNLPIPPDLEALNQETEERLLNSDNPESLLTSQEEMKIPVSKPDPQPAIKTSTQESQPPQKDNIVEKDFNQYNLIGPVVVESSQETDIPEGQTVSGIIKDKMENTKPFLEKIKPAEDKDLVALKNYILSNGFVVAMVAMHIRMLCTSAMTTPSTTDWDFEDRVHIPDLVLTLLRQPGYLEGIWPSLSIIMNTNKANPAWTAGIAMTIAFFDVIRTLPALKELKNEGI